MIRTISRERNRAAFLLLWDCDAWLSILSISISRCRLSLEMDLVVDRWIGDHLSLPMGALNHHTYDPLMIA